jgi:hypothetical protein
MLIADYTIIFLLLLILLLVFLSMKYSKVLLFYLGIFLWVFLTVFWEKILKRSWFNFESLNSLWNNFEKFFADSIIVNFFTENIKIVLFLTLALLFYRLTYYTALVLLHFIKWLSISIIDWVWNKKEKKDEKTTST